MLYSPRTYIVGDNEYLLAPHHDIPNSLSALFNSKENYLHWLHTGEVDISLAGVLPGNINILRIRHVNAVDMTCDIVPYILHGIAGTNKTVLLSNFIGQAKEDMRELIRTALINETDKVNEKLVSLGITLSSDFDILFPNEDLE